MRWLVLLCILLCNGCFLLGPQYKKPNIDILNKWPRQQKIKKIRPLHLSEFIWWKQFKSQELNDFIYKALRQNGGPQLALANIEYAKGQLEQVKLNWFPNLTVLTGYSQFPILGNPANTVIAYPLYVINILQLYKQQQNAEAIYRASIFARDCANLVVIAQTAASFFTLLAQIESKKLYQKLILDYQLYLKLATSQYHSGLMSYDEIDRIENQIQQIKSQQEITLHNIVMSENALHYLFNENPGQLQIHTTFKHIRSDALIPGNLPISVIENRPDIQEAEALIRAANANIGAATANLLPSLTVGSYLGAGSNIKGGIHLLEAYLNTPVVELPFWAQIKVSKAQYKAVYVKYIIAVRAALRDVANDLSAYSTYQQQLHNNTLAYVFEKRHCRLAQQRYYHGLTDQTDVVKCNIKLDELGLLVNQNKLEKMMAIVNLYQDLAGGYYGN